MCMCDRKSICICCGVEIRVETRNLIGPEMLIVQPHVFHTISSAPKFTLQS